MQQSNTNNDKIRPILAAMERSIDVARRKRLNHSDQVTDVAADDEADPTDSRSFRDASRSHSGPHSPPSSPSSSDSVPTHGTELGTNGSGHQDSAIKPGGQGDSHPPRLKARPKRPSEFFRPPPAESGWQSRAG